MGAVVEDIELPGMFLLFADLLDEIEALTSILIIDATLESLYPIFQQHDDRPAKRRKTTKGGARSLTRENGVSATGIPLGYIPLARLTMRIVGCNSYLALKPNY
jgi:hypothetical protein